LNKYSIKHSTKEQRKKYVKDAFAIGSLDSKEPPEEDLIFFEDYIEGKKELEEIQKEIIKKYTVETTDN
jgi:hypothetical protein